MSYSQRHKTGLCFCSFVCLMALLVNRISRKCKMYIICWSTIYLTISNFLLLIQQTYKEMYHFSLFSRRDAYLISIFIISLCMWLCFLLFCPCERLDPIPVHNRTKMYSNSNKLEPLVHTRTIFERLIQLTSFTKRKRKYKFSER
jgi:FlaA1/EpsC-like NDP-sugar epimerase